MRKIVYGLHTEENIYSHNVSLIFSTEEKNLETLMNILDNVFLDKEFDTIKDIKNKVEDIHRSISIDFGVEMEINVTLL